MCLLKRYGI